MAGTSALDSTPSFLNAAGVVKQDASVDARTEISREEFFQLLIAELQSQDPLEPMDNQQLMGQLAQLEELNTSTKMADGIAELTSAMRLGHLNDSSSLLGKVVVGTTREQAVDPAGEPIFTEDGLPVFQSVEVEGLAERVNVRDGETNIVLLVPITDQSGNAVTDSNGNILTREVSIPANTITQILDPLIGSVPYEDEVPAASGEEGTGV